MSRGEFTVIDATASKTADILRYSSLADQYRYRVYCVDFSGVSLEQCLKQNKMRPEEKWVPEEAIKNIYARFAAQGIPSGVTRILPDELDKVFVKPLDMSSYNKIVFIGDIHGCYDTLMQYDDFKNGLKDDTAYIFVGDYLDRGNQNAEVFKYLFSIMNKPNVCLLEGNHETHIRAYGMSAPAKSKEFEQKTRVQLACAGITDKEARMMGRKFRQVSQITYGDKEIFVCHGGVPNLMGNPILVSAQSMIHGVGEYKDYLDVANNWALSMAENQYMVFGHRNVYNDPVAIADRVFNLEGKVEFGGNLRIVELTKAGWNVVELPSIQPQTDPELIALKPVETVEEAVKALRDNKFVIEKPLGDNISAFNFSREAFLKGNWTRQTILARGLFVDTAKNEIVARSYEKFFRINEMPSTQLAALKDRLETVAIEKTKAIMSSAEAMTIIHERADYGVQVSEAVRAGISADYYVNVKDVVLTNIDFTDAFEKAVEEKVIAEQQKQAAITKANEERDVAEVEKDKKRLQAEGDAAAKEAVAKGDAAAKIAIAEGEATVKETLAKAEAKAATRKIAELAASLGYTVVETEDEFTIDVTTGPGEANFKTLVEEYIQYLAYLDVWDGELPNVVAGDDALSIIVPNAA